MKLAHFFCFRCQRGSFLVMVLWVIAILSVFCFSIGYAVHQRARVVARLEIRAKLRDLAEAGAKRMMNILDGKKKQEPFFDSLKEKYFNMGKELSDVALGDGSFSVEYETGELDKDNRPVIRYGAMDEERKINLNADIPQLIIKRLIEYAAGVDRSTADAISASIIDWKDVDDIVTDQGAENWYYQSLPTPYSCKNGPLDILEELLLVKGMNEEIYRKILPYVTLDSNGKVNINTASLVVLRAVGLSQSLALRLLEYRSGWDHLSSTGDDQTFESVAAITADSQFMELEKSKQSELESVVASGIFSVSSTHFSFTTIARLNHKKDMLVAHCLVERYGAIKRWTERFSAV